MPSINTLHSYLNGYKKMIQKQASSDQDFFHMNLTKFHNIGMGCGNQKFGRRK